MIIEVSEGIRREYPALPHLFLVVLIDIRFIAVAASIVRVDLSICLLKWQLHTKFRILTANDPPISLRPCKPLCKCIGAKSRGLGFP